MKGKLVELLIAFHVRKFLLKLEAFNLFFYCVLIAIGFFIIDLMFVLFEDVDLFIDFPYSLALGFLFLTVTIIRFLGLHFINKKYITDDIVNIKSLVAEYLNKNKSMKDLNNSSKNFVIDQVTYIVHTRILQNKKNAVLNDDRLRMIKKVLDVNALRVFELSNMSHSYIVQRDLFHNLDHICSHLFEAKLLISDCPIKDSNDVEGILILEETLGEDDFSTNKIPATLQKHISEDLSEIDEQPSTLCEAVSEEYNANQTKEDAITEETETPTEFIDFELLKNEILKIPNQDRKNTIFKGIRQFLYTSIFFCLTVAISQDFFDSSKSFFPTIDFDVFLVLVVSTIIAKFFEWRHIEKYFSEILFDTPMSSYDLSLKIIECFHSEANEQQKVLLSNYYELFTIGEISQIRYHTTEYICSFMQEWNNKFFPEYQQDNEIGYPFYKARFILKPYHTS